MTIFRWQYKSGKILICIFIWFWLTEGSCPATRHCYQLIAKPDSTAAVHLWSDQQINVHLNLNVNRTSVYLLRYCSYQQFCCMENKRRSISENTCVKLINKAITLGDHVELAFTPTFKQSINSNIANSLCEVICGIKETNIKYILGN